jgi:hypothetical protein
VDWDVLSQLSADLLAITEELPKLGGEIAIGYVLIR